jgi:OHCU decarboxylase
VAERAHRAGLTPAQDDAEGLHAAMAAAMRGADPERQLALIRNHPDLGERVAALTPDSRAEQASAGLDALDEAARARFLDLNARYRERFGFPFVMAVRDRRPEEILSALEERLEHDPETERAAALAEIETIARLRLRGRLPAATA